MTTPVALYARTSTAQPDALAHQIDVLRAYAQAQGWSVGDGALFVDEQLPGGDRSRPGLARLLAAVQAGEIATVVVYDVGRLSRQPDEAAAIEAELTAAGCTVVFAAMTADELATARRQQQNGWLRAPIAEAMARDLGAEDVAAG